MHEQTFMCIYSCSPSLALPPQLCLLSEQWWHQILIEAQILLHLSNPETITPACQPMKKLSSMKLVPDAKYVRDYLFD